MALIDHMGFSASAAIYWIRSAKLMEPLTSLDSSCVRLSHLTVNYSGVPLCEPLHFLFQGHVTAVIVVRQATKRATGRATRAPCSKSHLPCEKHTFYIYLLYGVDSGVARDEVKDW